MEIEVAEFIAGRSVYENCGAYVIVRRASLERLENAAPEIRSLLGSASRARTVAEMGQYLDALPSVSILDWRQLAFDDFLIEDLATPPPDSFYAQCVEQFFYDSGVEGYFSHLVLDTSVCYEDVVGIPEVGPFISTALHDLDAGIDDLEGAMRALQAAGHTCSRDDNRIHNAFARLMHDSYLRADEADPAASPS